MPADYYWPHVKALKPFFSMQSRIDSREKAFAFILGVLIGALLHCRSHHDNHTQSELFPLSQLLSLSGNDLWKLHDKVKRELENHVPTNSRDTVKAVAEEAQHLRTSLSRHIELDDAAATYFILYGISVSATICYHPCQLEGMQNAL